MVEKQVQFFEQVVGSLLNFYFSFLEEVTMKYTELKTQLESLLEKVRNVASDDNWEETVRKIQEIRGQMKHYHQERKAVLAQTEQTIRNYAFKLNEFSYAIQMILNPFKDTEGDPEPEAKPAKEREEKPKLVVGTFRIADYGFVMPKNSKGEPMSPAVEFEWDANRRYGGRSWEQAFITAIIGGGIQKAKPYFAPTFNAWLEETVTNQKGRYAGKPVYNNKRDFYGKFGIDIDPLTGSEVTKAAPVSGYDMAS